jgi:hypothetical protein
MSRPTQSVTNHKDDALLTALLAGANRRTAANQSGYSETTVSRRIHDVHFRRRYIEARQAVQDQTLTAVISAGPKGVLTLLALMSPTDEQGNRVPPAVRLAAAKAVVELGIGTLARVEVDATVQFDIEGAVESLRDRLKVYAQHAIDAEARDTDPA